MGMHVGGFQEKGKYLVNTYTVVFRLKNVILHKLQIIMLLALNAFLQIVYYVQY